MNIIDMKIKSFFTIAGVIGLVYGLFFLLMPEKAHEIYGIDDVMTEPSIRFQRYFGGSIVASALMVLMARTSKPSIALRSVLLYMLVFLLVNFMIIGLSLANGASSLSAIDLTITGGLLIGSSYLFSTDKISIEKSTN